MFAANQNRFTIAGVAEGKRGPDDALFLTFSKDNALLICADPVIDDLQRRCCRIKACSEGFAIFIKILDRTICNAAIHCRLGHR